MQVMVELPPVKEGSKTIHYTTPAEMVYGLSIQTSYTDVTLPGVQRISKNRSTMNHP